MCAALWSQEQTHFFLELLQSEPVIWDVNGKGHKDKKKVHDAWVHIQDIINVPLEDLKKKKDSLFATYRGYNRKVILSAQSGAGEDDVYRPVWFAYEFMDNFLGPVYKCKAILNTEFQDFQKPPVSNEVIAKKRRAKRKEILSTCLQSKRDISNGSTAIDEFEAMGISWAAKLRRLDDTQKVLAEDLINQVLKKGFFGELTRNISLSKLPDIGRDSTETQLTALESSSQSNEEKKIFM